MLGYILIGIVICVVMGWIMMIKDGNFGGIYRDLTRTFRGGKSRK